ncbi:hypothetical protein ACTA71_000477 [Dictyostelium dimigraforme]
MRNSSRKGNLYSNRVIREILGGKVFFLEWHWVWIGGVIGGGLLSWFSFIFVAVVWGVNLNNLNKFKNYNNLNNHIINLNLNLTTSNGELPLRSIVEESMKFQFFKSIAPVIVSGQNFNIKGLNSKISSIIQEMKKSLMIWKSQTVPES